MNFDDVFSDDIKDNEDNEDNEEYENNEDNEEYEEYEDNEEYALETCYKCLNGFPWCDIIQCGGCGIEICVLNCTYSACEECEFNSLCYDCTVRKYDLDHICESKECSKKLYDNVHSILDNKLPICIRKIIMKLIML